MREKSTDPTYGQFATANNNKYKNITIQNWNNNPKISKKAPNRSNLLTQSSKETAPPTKCYLHRTSPW